MLAKSSDVFRTMLYNKNWTQAELPEIELEETEECQKYFDTFLRFLYTAEVVINVKSAVGILCLADKYSVTSLKSLCTKYMVEHTRLVYFAVTVVRVRFCVVLLHWGVCVQNT